MKTNEIDDKLMIIFRTNKTVFLNNWKIKQNGWITKNKQWYEKKSNAPISTDKFPIFSAHPYDSLNLTCIVIRQELRFYVELAMIEPGRQEPSWTISTRFG